MVFLFNQNKVVHRRISNHKSLSDSNWREKGLLGIKIGQQMVEKDLLDKNRDSVPMCAFWGFHVISHKMMYDLRG